MNWGNRVLLIVLGVLFVGLIPHLRSIATGGHDDLQQDSDRLLEKIKRLEKEIETLSNRARVLRGGASPEMQRLADEEVARVARDELRMIGEGERIIELIDEESS